MRPTRFQYLRPKSIEDALEMLSADEESKALAGGHSILPAMRLRLAQPRTLVDIGRLPGLKGISESGSTLTIGALATHALIASSEAVRRHAPALASATAQVGDPQVRSWGTLGGNLAHADPASDPPTVVVASEGVIHTRGPGGARSIAAGDFFSGLFTTALEHGELITGIELPSAAAKKSAYLKMAHPASRYALVGVCVILEMTGDLCLRARVAVGGLTHRPTRCLGAEATLSGAIPAADTLEKAVAALNEDVGDELIGDHFAPSDYRRAMAGVYLKRAVRQALA